MKKLLAVCSILLLSLTGCENLTAFQSNPKVQFAEMEAIKLAQTFFNNGGSMDTAWGVSNGLNLIGDVASFALQQKQASDAAQATALAQAKLKQTVKDFAGDQTAVNGLATGVSNLIVEAKTPAEKSKVTLAIAAGIQKVATSEAP